MCAVLIVRDSAHTRKSRCVLEKPHIERSMGKLGAALECLTNSQAQAMGTVGFSLLPCGKTHMSVQQVTEPLWVHLCRVLFQMHPGTFKDNSQPCGLANTTSSVFDHMGLCTLNSFPFPSPPSKGEPHQTRRRACCIHLCHFPRINQLVLFEAAHLAC